MTMNLKKNKICYFKNQNNMHEKENEYFSGTDTEVDIFAILDKYIMFKLKDFAFFKECIFYSERENFYES